jgi:TonB family protein
MGLSMQRKPELSALCGVYEMNAVKKLAIVLSLGALSAASASAASSESAYLKTFTRGPGVPEPIKVVAPEVINAPVGAEAMISFVVDIAGVPKAITVAETTNEALASAAVEAVKQWRFTPVVRDGVTVETKVLLPVRVTGDGFLSGSRYASK